MDEILKTMRHAPFTTLPLLFCSPAAFAAQLGDLSASDTGEAASAAVTTKGYQTMQEVIASDPVSAQVSQDFFAQLGIPDYGQIFQDTGFDLF